MAEWGVISARSPQVAGRVRINDRVVTSIALIAACEVSGTVEMSSAMGRVAGRELPRASARLAGDRTTVSLDVAVSWPMPLPVVTRAVREVVRARLVELTGLKVDGVDVTAVAVVHPEDVEPERRVE